MSWEKYAYALWKFTLKPVLLELVKKTSNDWDDAAVLGVDAIFEKKFGQNDKVNLE